MFARSTWAEVVNDRCQIGELAGGVRPDIGSMGLFGTRHQHLHWRFVRVDHAVLKHCFAQGVHQWLKLYAAGTDPLSQG